EAGGVWGGDCWWGGGVVRGGGGVGVWGCTAVGAPCPAGVPLAGESSRVGGRGGGAPGGVPLAGRSLGLGGCGGPCPAGAPLAGKSWGAASVASARGAWGGQRAWATLRQRRTGGTSPCAGTACLGLRMPQPALASACGCLWLRLLLPACVGLRRTAASPRRCNCVRLRRTWGCRARQ